MVLSNVQYVECKNVTLTLIHYPITHSTSAEMFHVGASNVLEQFLFRYSDYSFYILTLFIHIYSVIRVVESAPAYPCSDWVKDRKTPMCVPYQPVTGHTLHSVFSKLKWRRHLQTYANSTQKGL